MVNPIPRIRQFYDETVSEVKKCTWPTTNELLESTAIVIVSLLMLTAFIWSVDMVTQKLIRFFILS